jgi:4-amino-4-deoxy-L-arabinose transferase-like glycosyltransferase
MSAAVALIIGWGALAGGFGLERCPVTQPDEVFYTEPARSLAQEGRWASPAFAGVRDLDHHFFMQPPVSILVRAAVLRLFGVGELQVRLECLAGYLLTALFLALLLDAVMPQRPRSRWLIAAAVFLFLCDDNVLSHFRSGRPDFISTALALGSAILIARQRRGPDRLLWQPLSAGLCLGTALMSHVSLVFVLPGAALAAVVPLTEDARPWRARAKDLAVASLGGAVPLGLWGAMIVQAPAAWKHQFLSHAVGVAQGEVPWRKALSFVLVPLDKLHYFEPMPLVLVGLLLVLPRIFRLHGMARIPALYLAATLPLLWTAQSYLRFYIVFVYALAALVLQEGMVTWSARGRRAAGMSLALVLLSAAVQPIARLGIVVAQWRGRDPTRAQEFFRSFIPPNETVVGIDKAYFLALANHDTFYYSAPLANVSMLPTDDDRAVFEKTLSGLKPGYAVLKPSDDPLRVLGFLPQVSFERLGTYAPYLWVAQGRPPARVRVRDLARDLPARTVDC